MLYSSGFHIGYNKKIGELEEKIKRLQDFLLKEFGGELEAQIREKVRAEILAEEKEKLIAQAKSELIEEIKRLLEDFEPKKERVVEDIFLKYQKELGFEDCRRSLDGKCDYICRQNGKNVRIEVERTSRNFIAHKHNPADVDLIVCWENNLNYAPAPIIELEKELPKIIDKMFRGAMKDD
jgi:hypothetical protein